jgi:hypothetical protein
MDDEDSTPEKEAVVFKKKKATKNKKVREVSIYNHVFFIFYGLI